MRDSNNRFGLICTGPGSTVADYFLQPTEPIQMIEPKRVLRGTLLEPLCERFDAGTLSLIELRHQLAAQLPEGTPTDITALLDQWIRLDILVPVAKSPNRFELNA